MEGQGKALSPRRRLVLFPAPLQGHITPTIQLANILHLKGFRITIIHTQFNSIDESKYPQFTFRIVPDGLSEDEASTSDLVLLFKILNVKLVNPFRECLQNLLSDPKEEPIPCLITDVSWYFTPELADSFKIPRIVFRTSSVCCFLAYNFFPLFHEKGYLPKKDSQLEERVIEFPPLKVKDIPTSKTRNPEDLYWVTGHMLESAKSSSGVLFNSCDELEEHELTELAKQFGVPVFAIGPLHKYFPTSSTSLLEQDPSGIPWLDSQAPRSVLYVSFGSVAEISENELAEVAWGLANSMQPFLWVLRPGLIQNSQQLLQRLPDGFLEAVNGRGYIVKWVNQQEVLAHPATGGFWTHSGWNSTLESICEGIPMICTCFLADQLINSRYVSDVWKIGVKLERGLEREEIETAIRKLMVDKEGQEMRARLTSLKKKIDFRLREGASSCPLVETFDHYVLSL